MDQLQARIALLKIAFVVLAASTWVFWSFMFATRPEEVSGDALTALVRLPASIPQAADALAGGKPRPMPEVIRMDMLAVPCWDKASDENYPATAKWVRITGRSCLGHESGEVESVRNLSNGYAATIFSGHEAGMTTDYIPLVEGQNDIQIRFRTTDGVHVENQFALIRQ